ncbi:hypothetical protein vseg_002449 [Gypsophila vaccaria]
MGSTKLSLKLLVDETSNRVLFAEAGKDFVDFLFHLLSLPVATVVKLINVKHMVGCIGELYTSIESLNSDYLLSIQGKDLVLNPKTVVNVPLLSLSDGKTTRDCHEPIKKFYVCSSSTNSRFHGFSFSHSETTNHNYVTDASGVNCPSCSSSMSKEMTYVQPKVPGNLVRPTSSEGYVKGVVTYMVMDHLAVKPMSTIPGITLINEFGVKDISSLVEKQVQVTLNEGVAILKASLETRAVLTKVFLGQKN